MDNNNVSERIKECRQNRSAVLDLSHCNLKEIPGKVCELTWLTGLNIISNQISDLEGLKGLTSLTELYLSGNEISEIASLKGLTSLTNLELYNNEISDIEGLKGLTSLTNLYLSGNKISDIEWLKGLTFLTNLHLNRNEISEIANLNGLTSLTNLYLNDNEILDIEGLNGLTSLTTLDLSDNEISEIASLKYLTSLTELYLNGNEISEIASLKDLTSLTNLYLRANQITEIYPVQNLFKLRVLNFNDNNITDITALTRLTELIYLNLANNGVTSVEPLEQLQKLRFLDLNNNQTTHLPNWVGQSKMDIVLRKQASSSDNVFNLYCNPIENIPLEIIDLGNEAIRGYMATLDEKAKPINEIKVIFLGEGASGKTSLMKRFCGQGFDKNEPQTHGINIKNRDSGVHLKLWDFGGQDIMHHTHQFFLTPKSVYVLVLNAREKSAAEYWLRMIEVFGGDSPIIVVMNKIDENPAAQENMKVLTEKYPAIKGYVRLSCQTDDGLEEFHKTIVNITTDLLHVKTRWGAAWLLVKEKLEEMRGGNNLKDYISYENYQKLCEERGVTAEQQDILIKWLNRLGIVTYFEDTGLNETNVINPEWLTEAFYAVINNKTVANQFGILELNQLPRILDKDRYSDKKYDFLLKLMIKFELCQQINPQTYLFPDHLTRLEPEFAFDIESALKFRFKYDSFLPKSILPKFVVRRYHQKRDELLWRSGMVIKHDFLKAEAFIRLDEELGELNIFVAGDDKRGFLYDIVSEFNNIHQSFKGLKYKKLIPCVCSECKNQLKPFYFNYDMLEKAVEKGRKDYPCDKSFIDVSIRELLGILFTEKDIEHIITQFINSRPFQIKKHLDSCDIDAFIEFVKSLFDSIPYLLIGKEEKSYHLPFQILLRSTYSDQARAEEMGNKGRIDSFVETDKYIYIFELKYNASAKTAMKQIHDRQYYKAYSQSQKQIILVGINFSEQKRNISDHVVEKMPPAANA